MSRSNRFRVAILLLLPAIAIVSGCGGGGSSGTVRDEDLKVTYFSMSQRTDVYRNQVLEIRLTAPVDPASATNRTFRILTGPQMLTPARGSITVDGNVIWFDPTRSQEALDRDGPDGARDIPFGFEASSDYTVYLPGPPDIVTLNNLAGSRIVSAYNDSFSTSDEYVPELDQPLFTGATGGNEDLEFEPEPVWDPDYIHTNLVTGQVDQVGANVVTYDAWFYLQFSETILPGTMDPGVTVKVENTDVTDALGNPFSVPGTITPAGDGSRYVFKPTFGYGSGPYKIRVTLTREITDLAGNPLLNAPLTIYFFTEYKEGVQTPGSLIETFSTQDKVDVGETTAEWDTLVRGELQGGELTTRVVTIDYKGDGINSRETLTNYPLVRPDLTTNPTTGAVICQAWANGVRMQQSYTIAELGTTPGTITEMAWAPDSNALFIATHNNIQITMGRVADPDEDGNPMAVITPVFKDNFEGGQYPVPTYSGRYDIPQRLNINPPGTEGGYWPYPTPQNLFDYDGTRGLLVDFNMDPGTDCQHVRGWNWGIPGSPSTPGKRNIVATSKNALVDNFTVGNAGQEYVFDVRFTFRRRTTVAQSLWYDTNVASPIYEDPVISPPVQANGASFKLEIQGATNSNEPDTFSEWVEDIKDLNDPRDGGPRFIRFRFTMYADIDSDTLTRIDQVTFPFQF